MPPSAQYKPRRVRAGDAVADLSFSPCGHVLLVLTKFSLQLWAGTQVWGCPAAAIDACPPSDEDFSHFCAPLVSLRSPSGLGSPVASECLCTSLSVVPTQHRVCLHTVAQPAAHGTLPLFLISEYRLGRNFSAFSIFHFVTKVEKARFLAATAVPTQSLAWGVLLGQKATMGSPVPLTGWRWRATTCLSAGGQLLKTLQWRYVPLWKCFFQYVVDGAAEMVRDPHGAISKIHSNFQFVQFDCPSPQADFWISSNQPAHGSVLLVSTFAALLSHRH